MPLPGPGTDFLESKSNLREARLVHIALRALSCFLSESGRESTPSTVCVLLSLQARGMRTESPLHQLSSVVREGVPEGVMLGIHHIPSEALLTRSPFPACEAVWTHCRASDENKPVTTPASKCQRSRRNMRALPMIVITIVIIVIVLVVSFEVPSSSSAESNHAP